MTESASALRIAIIGPTHPAKGGVAAHTTVLAHELADAGHDVVLVSWAQMFPSRLYPGEQSVPGGEPEVAPYPRTVPVLRWSRPEGWVRAGRRLRDYDAIVVVHVIPQVVPAHLAILRAAGVGRPGAPRVVGVVHNVLPHEERPGDQAFMRLFFGAVDGIIVHSAAQADLARELGAARVSVAALPAHLPGGEPQPHQFGDGATRLLSLGMVRDYKGVDLLLKALRDVPGLRLTIAGELWGAAGEQVRAAAGDPAIADRVDLQAGYVPASQIAELMARHDVLALTYRHATASQNVLLGQRHGLAVLATDVGTFGAQVRDGRDGLVVPANDHRALVGALHKLADPVYAAALRDGVRAPDLHGPWATYVGIIEAMAAAEAAVEQAPEPDAGLAHPGHPGHPVHPVRDKAKERLSGAADRARSVLTKTRATAPLTRADLPPWVMPSDLLATQDDAVAAQSLARSLRLSRTKDPLATWAALGAYAAMLRLRSAEHTLHDIIDCSGPQSPFATWLRAAGHTVVSWTLPDLGAPLDDLELDSASCDLLTMLHPGDCDGEEVDSLLAVATWVLRRGGLLVMTLAAGAASVPGAVAPADVRGVIARADSRGLVMVGDIDGDISHRLRGARVRSSGEDEAAYGIVRLTFRRR